jgi:hypothetical protein
MNELHCSLALLRISRFKSLMPTNLSRLNKKWNPLRYPFQQQPSTMSLKNTPTDTALGFEESPFAGSFEFIRRKTEHQAYSATIVKNASTGTVAPRLQDSQHSESKHQPNEVDIFGNPQVSRAHCHPHSTACAPVYGIFSQQAILGVDFEKDLQHGPELIRTLQQASCGKIGASKVETGLRFSPYNLVNLQTH